MQLLLVECASAGQLCLAGGHRCTCLRCLIIQPPAGPSLACLRLSRFSLCRPTQQQCLPIKTADAAEINFSVTLSAFEHGHAKGTSLECSMSRVSCLSCTLAAEASSASCCFSKLQAASCSAVLLLSAASRWASNLLHASSSSAAASCA